MFNHVRDVFKRTDSVSFTMTEMNGGKTIVASTRIGQFTTDATEFRLVLTDMNVGLPVVRVVCGSGAEMVVYEFTDGDGSALWDGGTRGDVESVG